MRDQREGPLGNMRFRVEIAGMQGSGAFEVIFPEARIRRSARNTSVTEYGTLSIRRGVSRSGDWFAWWDEARRAKSAPKRDVAIVLLDERGAEVNRWVFTGAAPSGYLLSNLNALGNDVLIETLDLSVSDVRAIFGSHGAVRRKK
jgi:phage tail-like protein